MSIEEHSYQTAVDLAQRGDMQSARNILKELIARHEDDEQTWVWLAATYASDESRVRILEAAVQRYPQGKLVYKALNVLQTRLETEEMRMVENSTAAPQLEFPIEPPPEQIIKARTVATPNGDAPRTPERAGRRPVGTPEVNDSSDIWKLVLAVGVVVITVLTAYLWTQLR